MNVENFLYLWLRRNDSEWIEQNLPAPQRTARIGKILNWQEIDLQFSEEIEIACRKILSSPDFPIRISISEILRRVGKRSWFDKRKEKLPKTNKTVNRNFESLEDFMLRKIEWTKEKFIREKKIPTNNQFQTRAIVRNSTSFNSSKIQKAINNSLVEIKESLSSQ